MRHDLTVEVYDTGGEEALREISRRKPNLKNRISPELESRLVALAIEQPAWGQLRVADELAKEGLRISACGVRGVWFRHDLHTMKNRLAALETLSAREGRVLTEAQVTALERVRHARLPPLRAVPRYRGYRAHAHKNEKPTDEWHRAVSQDPTERVLSSHLSEEAVSDA